MRSLERLREKIETLKGSLVIESAPGEIKSEIDAWGNDYSSQPLMRRVKEQLDPQKLLSPGRFVGGI